MYSTRPSACWTGTQDFWIKYCTLRNRITREVGLTKSEYYTDLFKEINDCKPYWQLVQNAAGGRSAQPRGQDGRIETSDQDKAEILVSQQRL